jgi:hypothetical protein
VCPITTHTRTDHQGRQKATISAILVARAPGIVCGYWLEPIDGVGMSVLVFETKEHAEAAAKYPVPPMPGVTLLSLTIREVYGSV